MKRRSAWDLQSALGCNTNCCHRTSPETRMWQELPPHTVMSRIKSLSHTRGGRRCEVLKMFLSFFFPSSLYLFFFFPPVPFPFFPLLSFPRNAKGGIRFLSLPRWTRDFKLLLSMISIYNCNQNHLRWGPPHLQFCFPRFHVPAVNHSPKLLNEKSQE